MFLVLVRLSRPLFLLEVALLYALGAGIARYLGASLDWGIYILGQAWLFTFQLGALFLTEYFGVPVGTQDGKSTTDERDTPRLSKLTILVVAFTCLAAVASLSVLMIRDVGTPSVFLFLALIFFGGVAYPVRLVYSGYGELTLSILVANLTPALAFLLQTDLSLRLVAMITFPLTVLHLAMMLVLELPGYATDMQYNRRTLMVRMGWQNGMLFHNLLILSTYLLLALAITFGLPWRFGLPVLLTLPLGLLQIWTINRIAAGARPHWKSLSLVAVVLFGAVVYLLGFGFWVR
jgi:1,4-dihydroxy-2-naphthoate octaprenyltransferase